MTATAVFTFFDRAATPTNLLTVQEWNRLSRAAYNGVTWPIAARKYALRFGGALVMRGDDSLVVFTHVGNGKVRRKTYAPQTWAWAA